MSILNWIALVLAVVLWIVSQNIANGVAMASSTVKEGSPADKALDHMETIGGIAAVGALLTFISQLIPIPAVKTVGLIILAISFLSVEILWLRLTARRADDGTPIEAPSKQQGSDEDDEANQDR